FDWLILQLQLAILEGAPRFESLRDKVVYIAEELAGKTAIPMVLSQLSLIDRVRTPEYWDTITLPQLEDVRRFLRDLIQFVEREARDPIYTDFTDQLGEVREVALPEMTTSVNLTQYKRKVQQFLAAHQNDRVLRKIRFAMPLDANDLHQLEDLLFQAGELGSREEFERAYGQQQNLGLFIRTLAGLDRRAAKDAFAEYLNDKLYTADQIRFVNYLIDHYVQNGIVNPGILYETPYTDINERGIEGVFPRHVEKILGIVRRLNQVVTGGAG
ncbi:MAG TPA: type I restriction-modification enzyme R subunit C-terminal domain-containing protein, partial [Anaerolineales bacterium]|nr:type I restriction-modification enzyme R subunit C-terminal domain-containing protein [Anaerolineales bacterium]